jgi:hypothetical protein
MYDYFQSSWLFGCTFVASTTMLQYMHAYLVSITKHTSLHHLPLGLGGKSYKIDHRRIRYLAVLRISHRKGSQSFDFQDVIYGTLHS